jgi:hypothetical protein
MTHILAMTTALAAMLLATVAKAANPPGTALVGSVTTPSIGRSGCTGNVGTAGASLAVGSSYIRPTASGPISVTLGELRYRTSNQQSGFDYTYAGSALLTFSTPTSGLARWDFIPTGTNVTAKSQERVFTCYTQSYDAGAHLLKLSFTINFGLCSLPVKGIFHG